MRKYCVVFVFLLLAAGICKNLHAQTDSVSSFLLPELKLYQWEKGGEQIYLFKSDYNFFTFANDTLYADARKYNHKAALNHLTKIAFRDGSDVWGVGAVGAAIGFSFGTLLGYVILSTINHDSNGFFHYLGAAIPVGLIVAVPFGLVGMLIGSISPAYEDFELPKSSLDSKRKALFDAFKRRGMKYKDK